MMTATSIRALAAVAAATATMALAQTHVGNFVTRIRRGSFTPTPPEKGCPAFCPAKNFCWHYSPARV